MGLRLFNVSICNKYIIIKFKKIVLTSLTNNYFLEALVMAITYKYLIIVKIAFCVYLLLNKGHENPIGNVKEKEPQELMTLSISEI